MAEIRNLADVKKIELDPNRQIHSAGEQEILDGYTTDIYFVRTVDILDSMGIADKTVTAEIFPRKPGIFAGIQEAFNALKNKDLEIWALPEGESFEGKETVMRIIGSYREICIYETILLGILASSCGWATAARECREACKDKSFIVFGSRHVHPSVAPVMERAAFIGGANGVSNILAAKLLGIEPSGTLPHASFLIAGDTVSVAQAYDNTMPEDHKRIVLIDTFKDEAEEALRVAKALGGNLYGIRLDTPSERGGVTAELVKEVRARLDMEGYNEVKIFVSGGLYPDKIKLLSEAGADSFGIGSYISGASAIDMTMDLKEIEGKPIAKRGRIPGRVENPKLIRLK
ncbi:nicotinate phosphoribosyltransferase [Lutispora sp.]|uniref:nicotinate phosphoribosyltransferase n=1 Tax=Lutispora sp. TaxID=2828727 RepID=UPI002B20E61B|nr:nicotinate phosphoribosyltransferase [Lutispora sp.]MEA4960510.1 nicotinate phosphoribosyltransferase [Lutispora sp.]